MRVKSWSEKQLRQAVKLSTSVRQVLCKLNLREAGGNYDQIKKYLSIYKIDTEHFKGQAWNKGRIGCGHPQIALKDILKTGSYFQSYKLKKRLFLVGLKKPECELCGWAKKAEDGRLPLELDHINGDRHDNRLINLRVLCPNCHSLQPTHRGRNIKK
jgi:hypothetical protein